MSLPLINASLPSVEVVNDDFVSSMCPQLSYSERLLGFLACLLFGMLISISSLGSFGELLMGHPLRFAILYSLGNLTSLFSTLFLVGFKRQIRNMTQEHRRISAMMYVSCCLLTICVAYFLPEMKWLMVLLVVLQWASLLWYTLSYIPFGRSMMTSLANRLLGYLLHLRNTV